MSARAEKQGNDPARVTPGLPRRRFLRSLGVGAAALAGGQGLAGCAGWVGGPRRARRPNIILLLADDLGYADLSCFDCPAVQTPNLDALAEGGTKLTQFYAASAVCTPTRASVLTGRYPLRFDIRRHFSDDERHLPAGTVTLPKLLQSAGYATGHVGKWHLGGLHVEHLGKRDTTVPGPHEHGFDHYQCQIEQQPLRGKMLRERRLYRDGGTCLIRDEKRVGPDDPYYDEHFTDINGDYAVELVERFHSRAKPFFLNLWWIVPHTPYEPAPEPHWSGTAADGISDDQHRWRSMVRHMDAKIGQLIAKLEELGIRNNTLILFTSDNGAAWEGYVGNLKGGKTDLHEGGIRVPAIVNWPGRVPPGETSDTLAHTNDLLPTFCAAAGVDVPASARVDGLNLLPHLLEGEPIAEERRGTVFWQLDLYRQLQRHYPKPKPYATEVARRGRWKLLAKDGKPVELFDLSKDVAEQRNVLDQHPEVAARLEKELRAWLDEPRQSPKRSTQ